jgi:hypothetical protein
MGLESIDQGIGCSRVVRPGGLLPVSGSVDFLFYQEQKSPRAPTKAESATVAA